MERVCPRANDALLDQRIDGRDEVGIARSEVRRAEIDYVAVVRRTGITERAGSHAAADGTSSVKNANGNSTFDGSSSAGDAGDSCTDDGKHGQRDRSARQ